MTPDDYDREILAQLAMRHAPTVSGVREAGLLYAKLLHWFARYGRAPSRRATMRLARNLYVDLLRSEHRKRVDRDGTRRGLGWSVTMVSVHEPAYANTDGPAPTVGEVIPMPEPVADPREAWELGSWLKELELRCSPRDCTIVAAVVRDGATLAATATRFGLTESRVCQIVHRAQGLLREWRDFQRSAA